MNEYQVKFRYSNSAVTDSSPDLLPGAFTFDSESLALYLDTDTRRVQIKDPLKLSLSGGDLTGDIRILDSDGTVSASISTSGAVVGTYFETTGDIALNTPPDLYAVIDSSGKICTRTKAQMIQDLGIANVGSLGKLAYVDKAIGDYTPEGTISEIDASINSTNDSVVKSIVPGNPSTYSVEGEVLSLIAGTKTTFTNVDVVKSISSVDVTQPVFTGKKSTITVNPES